MTKYVAVALLAVVSAATGCIAPPRNAPDASRPISVSPAPQQPPTTGADESAPGWSAVGTSVQGRTIRIQTLGDGPRRVLFIGGIHGDESEGSYTTSALPAAFTAAGLAERVTLTMIEDANPDGRVAKTRGNANGVDINRNFPARNFDPTDPAGGGEPLNQPESRLVNVIIEDTDPDLVIVMHSWENRQFTNYDGPAREIAERFAIASGLPLTASTELAPTPGSLGSYFGRDQRRPVLTIELRKRSDPKTGWETIRDGLIAAIGG